MSRAFELCMALLGVVVAAATVSASAQQPATSIPVQVPTNRIELIRFVDDAVQRARSGGELAPFRATLDAIVDSPQLGRIDTARQRLAFVWAGLAAYEARDAARAYALIQRVTALETATPGDWSMRSTVALEVGNVADAIASLTRVAEESPDDMKRVSSGHLHATVRAAAGLPDRDANLRLLSRLFELQWRRVYWGELSELWRELALIRIARGELREAVEVVGRIADPGQLVRARADRRFDPLLATNPELFDVAAAAAREVQRLEAEVLAAPDVIEPITVLAAALETSNRCEESLRVVDDAIARAAGRTAETRPFRDGGRSFPWLLDARARALVCLGRWDDAVRQRVQAATLTERGQPNTSQVINLAALYNDLGRPVEALAAIESVGKRSGYGNMQEQRVRFDAYVQLGNAEGIRATLAFMSEHREDALATYQSALWASGDADGAASLLIARLENPRDRADALYDVQRFASRLRTPFREQQSKGFSPLRDRSDVRAAIERVGRVESYPFLR